MMAPCCHHPIQPTRARPRQARENVVTGTTRDVVQILSRSHTITFCHSTLKLSQVSVGHFSKFSLVCLSGTRAKFRIRLAIGSSHDRPCTRNSNCNRLTIIISSLSTTRQQVASLNCNPHSVESFQGSNHPFTQFFFITSPSNCRVRIVRGNNHFD